MLRFCIGLFLLLSACGAPPGHLTESNPGGLANFGILGGKETTKENTLSKHLVLIYDTPSKSYCTGVLISQRVVLTAAHCVDKSNAPLTLAFGLQPLTGKYILRQSATTVTHPNYQKNTNSDRNDLALIKINGSAPAGYAPVELPGDQFPLKDGLTFTAAGYGRTSGKKDVAQNGQGSGVLRNVDLKIDSLSANENQFYIDQKSFKGICSGDSGGPALMRYLGRDYVVGVASAISWTVPEELQGPAKQQYIDQKDICAEKSIYMNVKKFRAWIAEATKNLDRSSN